MEIAKPEDKRLDGVSVHTPMGFENNTFIFMKDKSSKAIGSLAIGEELLLGGKVTNIIKDKSIDVFNYKGTICTGNMKVLEDGRWILVSESGLSRKLTNESPTEITIIQSEVMLLMTYDYEVWSSNLKDVTVDLNSKHELNSMLVQSIKGIK